MRILFQIIVLLNILSSNLFAMDKKVFEDVVDFFYLEKWNKADSALMQMEESYQNDPEYYVLLLNYYFLKNQSSVIVIQQHPPELDSTIVVLDSAGSEIAYFNDSVRYDKIELQIGLDKFKKGLLKFEDRLDMHFGYVYVTKEVGFYEDCINSMKTIITLSDKYIDTWKWSFNTKHNEPSEEFILSNIQANISEFFYLENSVVDSMLIGLSELMIEYYPENIFGYTTIGVLYLSNEDYDESERYLLRAKNINEQDLVVLSNLAQLYKNKLQIQQSIEYYKKIIKYGDENDKVWAKKQIEQLN